MTRNAVVFVAAGLVISPCARADDVTLIPNNFDLWAQSAGTYTTITFDEFPSLTNITSQYSDLGVLFTDPDANISVGPGLETFPQDGWGLQGFCYVETTFDQPINAIAWHFAGIFFADFYLHDTLIYSSTFLGGPGVDHLIGAVSSIGFDRVSLRGIPMTPPDCDDVVLDNLYFSTIPAPGAACVLLGLLMPRQTRRRSTRPR